MRASLDRRQILVGTAALVAAGAAQAATLDAVAPRLNQVGYLPDSPKRFSLPVSSAAPRDFTVEDDDGQTVFTGRIETRVYDMTAAAGERVVVGDFSGLTTPGRFRVRMGEVSSAPFVVGDDVYGPVLRDALRGFYIIRANVPLDDAVTGIKHGFGHPSDAHLMVDAVSRDLTGGWYNAGDYGKWTIMAAISASEMMWLYELRPAAAQLVLDIPQTYNGLPDILQQARWGLDWLLKMQNADGGVLHKVDTEPNFAWGKLPEDDPNIRAAHPASSIDAGVFAAVMAQACRVFGPLDAAFASGCREAALKAWAWLQAHPNVTHDDPYYADKDASQETAWAMAEIAGMTRDAALEEQAWQRYTAFDMSNGNGLTPFLWSAPQALGAVSLVRSGSAKTKAKAMTAITLASDWIATGLVSDPYGFSDYAGDYGWGSLEYGLDRACQCMLAFALTGEQRHRDTGQKILDYALGHNALDRSLVTGHGTRRTEHPYHWAYRTQKIALPGWPSGGPNGQAVGADPLLAALIAKGTAPAKCFVDACEDNGSWASNEGTTTETAALALAIGLFSL